MEDSDEPDFEDIIQPSIDRLKQFITAHTTQTFRTRARILGKLFFNPGEEDLDNYFGPKIDRGRAWLKDEIPLVAYYCVAPVIAIAEFFFGFCWGLFMLATPFVQGGVGLLLIYLIFGEGTGNAVLICAVAIFLLAGMHEADSNSGGSSGGGYRQTRGEKYTKWYIWNK